MDSVSVATFWDKLSELGVIFCSMGEATQEHPEIVKKYLAQSCFREITATRR